METSEKVPIFAGLNVKEGIPSPFTVPHACRCAVLGLCLQFERAGPRTDKSRPPQKNCFCGGLKAFLFRPDSGAFPALLPARRCRDPGSILCFLPASRKSAFPGPLGTPEKVFYFLVLEMSRMAPTMTTTRPAKIQIVPGLDAAR